MYSCSGSFTPPLPIYAAVPGCANGIARHHSPPPPLNFGPRPACRASQPCPAAVQGEGMLHDARNLMGALGLYCDLLSMPGELKPEHNHYPVGGHHLQGAEQRVGRGVAAGQEDAQPTEQRAEEG